MRVLFSRVSITLALTLATSPVLLADYTYQETTQLTGGSLLNMMKMVGHFSSQARKAGVTIAYGTRAANRTLAEEMMKGKKVIRENFPLQAA